ncbi:MAG: hypothetical protein Q8R42_00720, partial [Desulfocapsaceae bacterium]|nr:hypothetical protein [Desulfocapsaceae bacterium]
MHFLHIVFFGQFSFLENIPNMAGYNRLISLEQFHHLGLAQPDRLLPEVNFEQALPALGLIDDYFTLFVLHATPRYRRFEKKKSWSQQVVGGHASIPATQWTIAGNRIKRSDSVSFKKIFFGGTTFRTNPV